MKKCRTEKCEMSISVCYTTICNAAHRSHTYSLLMFLSCALFCTLTVLW